MPAPTPMGTAMSMAKMVMMKVPSMALAMPSAAPVVVLVNRSTLNAARPLTVTTPTMSSSGKMTSARPMPQAIQPAELVSLRRQARLALALRALADIEGSGAKQFGAGIHCQRDEEQHQRDFGECPHRHVGGVGFGAVELADDERGDGRDGA